MKKKLLFTVTVTLSFSLNAYALGLGNLTVNSYLDQNFDAEIELIDIGGMPLSGIKATLASAEDYQRMGLERVYGLTLLTFTVEKNTKGKPVVKIHSSERISEPYMQMLVDLVWAQGQVERAYTILLDPPNYKLVLVKKQLHNIVKRQYESEGISGEPGVVKKSVYTDVEREPTVTAETRGAATYGPTVANETIWQIAQHYKTGDVTLQQLILAIVGTNPQAFTEGNLNGLKEGSRLLIPSIKTVSKVPAALSTLEVEAHDKAWQSRQAIQHALLPPYIGTTAPAEANEKELSPLGYPLSISKIPSIATPKATPKNSPENEGSTSRLMPLSTSLLSLGESFITSGNQQNRSSQAPTAQEKMKAEMDIAAAAIDSVRESNALLIEQLRSLQSDNKRLQDQLLKSEREMNRLREQIRVIIARQGLAGQVSQQPLTKEEGSNLLWILLLLAVGAGAGYAYWRFRVQPKVNTSSPIDEPVVLPTEDEKLSESSNEVGEQVAPVRELPIVVEDVVPEVTSNVETPSIEKDELAIQPPQVEEPSKENVTEEGLAENDKEVKKSSSDVAEIVTPEDTTTIDLAVQPETELKPAPELVSEPEPEPEPEPNVEDPNEHLLEFEPGLHQIEPEKHEEPAENIIEPEKEAHDEHALDFVIEPVSKSEKQEKQKPKKERKLTSKEKVEPEIQFEPSPEFEQEIQPELQFEPQNEDEVKSQSEPKEASEQPKPAKSKAALNTLLDLAKVYIGMEDFESAKQSLSEILEHGSDKQKQQAQKLLDEIGKK